jgi:hypothetical protein
MARVVTSHHGQIVNVPEHTAALLFPARPGLGTDRQPASRRARKPPLPAWARPNRRQRPHAA